MTKWKIIDWMGNRIYPDQVFDTFEDGRHFIDCKVADPEEHQEYYVVEMKLTGEKEQFKDALKIEDEEEDDYTLCDGCDDYFLDDERCECEEG